MGQFKGLKQQAPGRFEGLGGGIRTRKKGVLIIVSDERSGKPAHSQRLASRPLRPVFLEPAPPALAWLRPEAAGLPARGTRAHASPGCGKPTQGWHQE